MLTPLRRAATRIVTPGVLAAGLFAFAALGCQQQTASESGASPAAGESPAAAAASADYPAPSAPEGTLKVGLITPGSISDKGWNASANEGLQRIKKELGAETTPPVESVTVSDVAGAARNLAQGGDHLIFFHGSEFDEGAAGVAPDFPKTTFVVVGGRTVKPNLTPIQFAAGDGTYLAGVIAGGMTKANKVACVGAAEIPIVKDSFESFRKGVQSINPKAEVKVVFIGDEADISKGKQQTQALLAEGVDVVLHNANAAGQGVAQAVMEKEGALFIGANAPQDDLATPKNLGSFIIDAPSAYLAVGRAVKEGKGEGKPFSSGLKDHAVYFHYNPGFKGAIPAPLKAKVAEAEKGIIAGTINPAPDAAK